jgi:hypothetical protein
MQNNKRLQIYQVIDRERDYQDKLWGGKSHDKKHSIEEWLEIISDELSEVYLESNPENKKAELVQTAASIVACLEQIGVVEGHG